MTIRAGRLTPTARVDVEPRGESSSVRLSKIERENEEEIDR